MTSTDESVRPVDRFESARLTALQHVDDGMCFHCCDNECKQQAWAVEELARHAGGRNILSRLGLRTFTNSSTSEGQKR
ncbi:hypothetical protein NKG94_17220 [Micromonospora sp. M12]